MFDWIDDSACIMVCKDPSVVESILRERFSVVACVLPRAGHS